MPINAGPIHRLIIPGEISFCTAMNEMQNQFQGPRKKCDGDCGLEQGLIDRLLIRTCRLWCGMLIGWRTFVWSDILNCALLFDICLPWNCERCSGQSLCRSRAYDFHLLGEATLLILRSSVHPVPIEFSVPLREPNRCMCQRLGR